MPGRARLRVLSVDSATLDRIGRALAEHRSVVEVRASARTGSLLITHRAELEPILEYAAEHDLFCVTTQEVHAPMRRILQGIEDAEARLGDRTQHALSLGGVAAVAMLAAAIYQARRGHLFPASTTLIKDALNVVSWVASREPPDRA